AASASSWGCSPRSSCARTTSRRARPCTTCAAPPTWVPIPPDMCGIAGFVGEGSEAVLREMGRAIAHRGPDGHGIHIHGPLHLLQRRRAIIAIAGGDQPMWNETRDVCVIFNGEIYNHLELRAELKALGHTFASDHSDTEVIVHGYEAWGEALATRLNGMFAL